jgi:dCMP deaminase
MSHSQKWQHRYLDVADLMASWSKDPSTKCGAVLVSADGKIVSTGYNGFPKGLDDSLMADREYKAPRVIHAERNALANARQDVRGMTLYVTHPCCPICANLISAFGLAAVVCRDNTDFGVRYEQSITEQILRDAGIEFITLSGDNYV